MFADHAQKYFEKGLSVIPLMPRLKNPAVKSWGELSYRLPTQEEVDKWSTLKNANIGIVCGEASKIIALDIDKEDMISKCPQSPVSKKGKKGETRFFKFNNEPTIHRNGIGIEILSNGAQTVIPPSIHPDTGLPYLWIGKSLLDIDLEDLPILPLEFVNWLGIQSNAIKPGEAGRNNALVRIAGGMIERGESITDVVKELLRHDQENHNPPYFSDPAENHRKSPEFVALALATRIFETASKKDITTSTLGTQAPVLKITEPKPKKEIIFPTPKSKVLEVLTKHILDNSEKPRYPFSLISAITTCGIVLANKFSFYNEAPTIYSMLVTESGGGKDTPMKAPELILSNLNLGNFVGLNEYRSDAAIIASLAKQPERIDRLDEASKLYSSMKGGNQHTSKIGELLSTLYTSTNGLFRGHRLKDGDYGYCWNPCLSIIGGTTPATFSKTFSEDFLDQGFGARFLYFYDSADIKERGRFNKKELPSLCSEWLTFWGKTIKVEREDFGVEGIWRWNQVAKEIVEVKSLPRPKVIQIMATENADQEIDKCIEEFERLQKFYPDKMKSSLRRALQNVKKIALIHAATRSGFKEGAIAPNFKVDGVDVIFARDLVMACMDSTCDFFQSALAEDGYRKHVQNLCQAIEKYGPITLESLTRKTRRYSTNDRNKLLKELVASGEVLEYNIETLTKPKKVYSWNHEYAREEID